MSSALMTTYNRLPVAFERGEGVWLFDKDGNAYLDGIAGIAVTALGHSHPEIVKVITDQASKLLHTSNIYQIDYQSKLAEKLVAASGMDNVFFANSGAEVVDAAIKLSRLYGHKKGIDEPKVIVMHSAFHGRTMGGISASGNKKVQAGFEPLLPGFVHIPYDDIPALEAVIQQDKSVIAVMLEPVQGEAGVNIPTKGYLKTIRHLCDKNNLLMILDEIQTGMGRTGKLFAYQHENIIPDVMTLAKALGNGIPIGACLARGEAATLFQPGNHGSTFGGNPLACRVGLSVLEIMQHEKLAENAATMGERILSGLKKNLSGQEVVANIRGKGLMIGIELNKPCREILHIGLKQKVLFSVTAEKIIRLVPPLILTEKEADLLVERISSCVLTFALN